MSDDQTSDAPPDSGTEIQQAPPLHLLVDDRPATEPLQPAIGDNPSFDRTERYRLVEEIARGGMGVVYLARDLVFDRDVGLKTLLKVPTEGSSIVSRFREEARITGQLQHPNIPPVHDLGTLPDGRPFLAMKLIKGQTLDALLRARIDPSHERGRFLAIFEQIAQGVAYAHSLHIIHRDLKPLNVMVGAFGEVQVMDWGLAKVLTDALANVALVADLDVNVGEIRPVRDESNETQAGTVMGTPAYVPPEQAIGAVDLVDTRSDVFSLGGVLCTVLTGRPPFVATSGETALQLAAGAKLDDAFARLDSCGAEPELVALCKRCLSAKQDDRPRDAGEVANAVAELRAESEKRARQAELDLVRVEGELAKTQLRAAEQRNKDALAVVLERCEESLRNGDSRAAAAAWSEVEQRRREGGTEDFSPRIARCWEDLAMLKELDHVDHFRWTVADGKLPPASAVAAGWERAFADFQILPGETLLDKAARRVTTSLIRDRLLAALDLWLVFAPSRSVAVILNEADPDDYRGDFRAAVCDEDGMRGREIASQEQALSQPARFAVVLSLHPGISDDRRRMILEKAILARPGDLFALMSLGLSYPINEAANASSRLRWYQAAIAAHPRTTAAYVCWGLALKDAGDLDGAIAAQQKAIQIDPEYALAHYNLGNALKDKGDLEGAIAACKEALRIDPKFAPAHNNLGIALRDKGDVDGAIEAFEKAIKHDPTLAPAHTNLGFALKDRGDLDRAIASYKEAIKHDPEYALAHTNLGFALQARGDVREAIAAYKEAIKHGLKYAPAYNNLGNALMDRGDVDGAIASYQEAIKHDPKLAPAHNNLGNALMEKGDVDGAIAAFKEAIEHEARYASAYNNLGNALLEKGDVDSAIAAYRETIERDPRHAQAYNALAWLFATGPTAVRNGTQAVECGNKACELTDWEEPYDLETLAAAFAEAGNFEKAIEYQNRALSFPDFERANGPQSRQQLELYTQRKPYRDPAFA